LNLFAGKFFYLLTR